MKTQEVTGNGTIGEGQGRDLSPCGLHASCGFDPRPRSHSFTELQPGEIPSSVEIGMIVPKIVLPVFPSSRLRDGPQVRIPERPQ